jgi:uncharacterized membrane protein
MAKLRGNADSTEGSTTAWGAVRENIDDRVNTSGRLVLGFLLFYSAWLLAAYGLDTVAESDAISAMAAVMFWFGIVFAVLTVVFGVLLGVLNFISEMRR